MVTLRTFNLFHHLDCIYKLTKEYKASQILRADAVKVSRTVLSLIALLGRIFFPKFFPQYYIIVF